MSTTDPSNESSFWSFRLNPSVQRGIAAAGFVSPRPIQLQTIPACLDGRDILGLARTGTGKTAAFALPLLERIHGDGRPGPRALIVAPTRELASQICAEIRVLAQFTKIRCVTVFGGVSERPQVADLKTRPEIVVACPGRLLDLVRRGATRLDRVETLVLDEADHMFDMGFLPDIRRILALLPERRQNLLFSATMPKEVRALALELLSDPVVVDLTVGTPPLMIEHALYPVAEGDKRAVLERLLKTPDFGSAIVFTRTKHRAKRLAVQLSKAGHRAIALQGNMSQGQRDRAMEGFRRRKYDVLVATDIAARGIDVERVSHVVNFDMPNTVEAYTHRAGRTGRSGQDGKAYTLVTLSDGGMVQEVERVIGSRIPRRGLEGTRLIDFPSAESAARRAAVSPAGRQSGHSRPEAGAVGARRYASAGDRRSKRGRPRAAAAGRRRPGSGS